LSKKVWDGCATIARQGYWAGGSPPYGLHRLLLDERREPVHVLAPGQRKSIQNQRVTLVMGEPAQVAVLRRIFYEFVDLRYSEFLIAERLNAEAILSAKGLCWTAGKVVHCLRNEKYAARSSTTAPARSSKRLATPIRPSSGSARRRPLKGSSHRGNSTAPRRSLPNAAANTFPMSC